MKIPLTDKFLWDLYNFLEKAGKIAAGPSGIFTIKTWKKICYPHYFEFWQEYKRKKQRKHFAQFINYLKKSGYIKIKNLEGKKGILLTPKGKNKALKTRFKLLEKKKREDRKWIMVIFDIPERKRDLRDLLRENLQILGYKKFQQSVWVCPYDVLKETESTISQNSLDSYVRIFLIEEVEV